MRLLGKLRSKMLLYFLSPVARNGANSSGGRATDFY